MEPGGRNAVALVVDDHPATRHGFADWLGTMPGIGAVIEADTVAGAVAAARRYEPGLALINLDLPDGSGLEAGAQVRAAFKGVAVLMMAGVEMDVHLAGAYQAGAVGFVPKTVQFDRLAQLVSLALNQRMAYTDDQMNRIRVWHERVENRLARLTAREREVFVALVSGPTNAEIATALAITKRTVECHVQQVFAKLGFSSRRELAGWVQSTHLVQADSRNQRGNLGNR
jgi:DNA-binding NarL/FixJ family response regulator